jgi:flagellar biosynthesis chaperone FliJ
MAVSRSLRRLLKLRHLEEEQSRVALESALSELHRLERALEAAGERGRLSRRLLQQSVRTGELPDRIAAIEEGHAALRQTIVLEAAILNSKQSADTLRANYQLARVERRQVEILVQEAEAAEALDTDRRSQQSLDDRYGSRRQVAMAAAARLAKELEEPGEEEVSEAGKKP